MKKAISLIICACMLSVGASCGGTNGGKGITEAVPEYSSDKNFMLGMWIGVPDSLKTYDGETGKVLGSTPVSDEDFLRHYRDMKEAGFTVADAGYGESTREYNVRALNAAKEAGMGQLISDRTVLNYLMSDTLSDEQIIEKVTAASAYFKDHEAFWGLRVRDEPQYHEIPMYQHAQELFRKIFPGKIFYVNLLPIVSSKESVTSDYGSYIKQYTKYIKEDYVSFDHYVLKTGASGNYLLQNLVTNLTMVKRNAPGLDAWFIAQGMSFGGTNRTLTSSADTNFQAYTALACGYAGISWFCYWSPPTFDGATSFGEAAIDRQGNKTAIYDYIKETNNDLLVFSDVYFNFDWQGIVCNIGTENENGGDNDDFAMSEASVVQSERISSLKTQQDTLVGVFKDGEGRDGYMFVNYTEPSAGKKNEVTVTFNDCAGAVIYAGGEKSVVNAENGKIIFTQDSGDGFFVVPLK